MTTPMTIAEQLVASMNLTERMKARAERAEMAAKLNGEALAEMQKDRDWIIQLIRDEIGGYQAGRDLLKRIEATHDP
jgi:hypothetical protein